MHSPTSKIDKIPHEMKCHIRAQCVCGEGGVHKVLIRQSTFFNLGVEVMEKSTPKSIISVEGGGGGGNFIRF